MTKKAEKTDPNENQAMRGKQGKQSTKSAINRLCLAGVPGWIAIVIQYAQTHTHTLTATIAYIQLW